MRVWGVRAGEATWKMVREFCEEHGLGDVSDPATRAYRQEYVRKYLETPEGAKSAAAHVLAGCSDGGKLGGAYKAARPMS